jgi:hypothetical protein
MSTDTTGKIRSAGIHPLSLSRGYALVSSFCPSRMAYSAQDSPLFSAGFFPSGVTLRTPLRVDLFLPRLDGYPASPFSIYLMHPINSMIFSPVA